MKKKKIFLITIICSLILIVGLVLSTIFIFVPSSKYSKAINHYNNGEYETAEKIFTDLGNYKDSEEQLKILDARKSFNEKNIEEGIEIICSINGVVNVTYDLDNNVESFTETLNSTDYKLYAEQSKVGYNFLSWDLLSYSIDNTPENYSATISLKAIWIADTDTRYTVNYYLENYEDTNYTLEKTDVLYGETSTIVNPMAIEYEGFIEPEVQSLEILPDGSAQLNYYYKREMITLSFVTNGGTSVNDFETKWGTPIADLPTTTRVNYTFGGWFNDLELTEQYEVFKSSDTLYAYWEEEYKPSNFTYELYDGGYVLLDTSLGVLEKQIPTYIGDNKLLTISANALANIEASSLIIPETVTYIEEDAFANSSISELIIPTSVKSVDKNAFRNITNLTTVKYNGTIADWCNISFENQLSNPMAIATEFYLLCESGYELVTDLVVTSEVEVLGDYQFYGFDCVTSVTVADSVSYIGENVFTESNNISNLSVPFIGSSEEDSLNSYLGYFFGGTSYALNYVDVPSGLTSVSITNTLEVDDYALYNCDMVNEVILTNTVLNIGEFAFANTLITNIVIPDSVTSIGYGAFKYCPLESITLPFVGNTIENHYSQNGHFGYIFGADSSNENSDYVPSTLKTVTITNALEIDSYAFEGLNFIEEINLPDTLLRINSYAFNDCTGLRYIHIPTSVEVIEEGIFEGVDDLVIYLESSATESNWYSNWNNNKPIYYGVNEDTFHEENNIQYVISNGEAVLTNCLSDEEEIVIPETITHNGNTYNVTSIGDEAFYGCSLLEKITMTSIETIGASAFKGCTNLVNASLSNNLLTIETYAFYNTGLEVINIPLSVETVETYAFANCDGLIIYCEGTPNIVSDDGRPVYYNVTAETYLEENGIQFVVRNGNAVVTNYVGTETNVVIPNTITIGENTYNITTIGEYAFENNFNIITVELPNTLTTIETYAFTNCSSLTTVTIPTNVTSIGYRGFNNCKNLTIYTDYNQREAREAWGNNWYYGCYVSYSSNY